MSRTNHHKIKTDDEHSESYVRENRKRVWREAKRSLRRNVKLRIKKGLYEELREKPKVDTREWYDDGQ